MILFYTLATILAWGLWLVPSQSVRFEHEFARTFYVSLANLGLTWILWVNADTKLSSGDFLLSLACGVVWIFGAVSAFSATRSLGIARAFGIWSPLNVVVSVLWGALLWGEIIDRGVLRVTGAFVAIGIAAIGIRMIALSDRSEASRLDQLGFVPAVLAGVLWGSYFIPMQLAELSPWAAAFPMAVGMLIGATLLNLPNPRALRIRAGTQGYALTMLSGALWGIGNFTSLRLMELVGTGVGFTLAQLCLIVNALAGIYVFRNPPPNSSAAWRVLSGSGIAISGAVGLFLAK